eukprot:TRINITY_DN4031_c0_g1_i2.p1 TRINITY_DN4031_c0_g1~~TRINITY_DN4031_c0_g1_i2.p1  ORF type:complete len:135 (+),score=27.84 TRINITY_DN4031_c0_g1_i2:204-608(+)
MGYQRRVHGSHLSTSEPSRQAKLLKMGSSLKLCLVLAICTLHCHARRQAKRVHTDDLARLSKLELLKETSNNIGHGPEYASHHKQLKYDHKGSSKHRWVAKKKEDLQRNQRKVILAPSSQPIAGMIMTISTFRD